MNIKDIAKICGVSAATVSKVLHNEGTISSETRERVLSVVKEYNYVPYSAVLKNAGPKMNVIAVILDDSYFKRELLYHIEKEAFQRGYNVILCDAGSEEEEQKYLHVLENKGINGVITLCGDNSGLNHNIPMVSIVGEAENTEEENRAYIRYDLQKKCYIVVKYLIGRNHRKIACLIKGDFEAAKEGYIKAYEEIFTPPRTEWLFRWEEEALDEITAQCVRDGVTAIVCPGAEQGSRIYEELRRHGIFVPEQMSVICLGDAGIGEHLVPKMTAVEFPISQMAKHAVKALVGMMEKQEPGRKFYTEIEPQIVERDSVHYLTEEKNAKIVVVGSMNMDYYFMIEDVLTRGGTIRIKNTLAFPGGEGANQAVGIGKLGGNVYILGCLGNDQDGKVVLNSLVETGVRTEGVTFYNTAATGKAYIVMGADREGTVILQDGANSFLSAEYIRKCSNVFDGARFCLLSMELPKEAIEQTVKLCKEKDVRLIVKAPATDELDKEILNKIDYLVASRQEAERIAPGKKTVEERAEKLFAQGVKNVIITVGYSKSYLKNDEIAQFFETEKFPAVDAIGVTDAFISAMTADLSKNHDIVHAVRLATYAAGVSVTRVGVQQSMIDKSGLERYEEHLSSMKQFVIGDAD